MTAPPLDEFMLRLAPAPPLAVDPALLRARSSIRGALADLAAVDETAMEKGWPWRGDEADIRYGFYRQYEALEDVRARLGPILAEAYGWQFPARPLVGAATAARWDLHGLLAGLPEEVLDADPGNGEWTVRQTLAHIVNGQRAYGWFTSWWLSQRHAAPDDFPPRVPDDVASGSNLPEEATEALGELTDIRARLDEILDLSAGVFAPLGDEDLAVRARWSGVAVDVRFRLGRWASHIREHTIQVEKTLAIVGHPLAEVPRLVRLVAGAWGRLEADLYMWPSADPSIQRALSIAEEVSSAIAADAGSVRIAAS